MRLTTIGIAVILALVLTTGTASATLVDDFSLPTGVIDLPGGGGTADGGVGPVGPFTTRTLTAISSGTNSLAAAVSGGQLSLNPFVDTVGTGQVLYTGGGPIDFSAATAFTIDHVIADFAGGDLFIEVFDGATTSALIDFTGLGTLGTGATTLSLSTAHAGFAGINFATIQTIHLVIDTGPTTANDMSFDNFQTTDIPEPATMLLMGAGLVALGVIGRRRRLTS